MTIIDIRSVFTADPGHVLLEVDASQIEDRLVKALTGSPNLLHLASLEPGKVDVHRLAAAEIFHVIPEAVTKQQRDLGKRVVHATNYGMGARTFQDGLVDEGYYIPLIECKRMIDARLAANPEVLDWQRCTRIELLEYRQLVGIFGHTWRVPYDRMEGDLFRRAYAYRPQNGAATLVNQRMFIPLDRALQGGKFRGARIVNNVHDSVMVSTPPEHAYDIAKFLLDSFEQPVDVFGHQLMVWAEVKVGKSWGRVGKVEYKRLPSRGEFEQVASRLLPSAPSPTADAAAARARRGKAAAP